MAINLNLGFFTLPDPEISQESSVDPMGLQVIWTWFGQQVFQDKLTTVANDLRIFTFNIFHHHLIRKLTADYAQDTARARERYKDWTTESDMKLGLLIFLQDLATHIFYQIGEDEADKLGMLGLSKANREYYTKKSTQIFLVANKRAGLLKKQLQLGMTGRYKGPMVSMRFIDDYHNYPDTSIWEQVEAMVADWPALQHLCDSLIEFIVEELLTTSSRSSPKLSLREFQFSPHKRAIVDGHLACFGKANLPAPVRAFWLDKLGLNSGAPAAVLEEVRLLGDNPNIDHQKIFAGARKRLKDDAGEREKVERILQLEPFLSHAEFLLRYVAQPRVKRFDQEQKNLQRVRDALHERGGFALEEPKGRLREVQDVLLQAGSLETWIINVLDFHKRTMEQRGGAAWVTYDKETGSFRHHYSPRIQSGLTDIDSYFRNQPWLHTYYLETLRSINKGLKS
jgi:hypothetical protein